MIKRSVLAATAATICLGMLIGCASSLLPKPAAQQTVYALGDSSARTLQAPAVPSTTAGLTLIVNATRAAPGYDTALIAYQRRTHEIEYFVSSRWVEPPAQMLAPMIARAIQHSAAFAAVVRAPTSAAGELRLDTELVFLRQEFIDTPSVVRLSLHAVLIDSTTRRVVGTRDFEVSVASASDDAQGGVVATNNAVQQLLPLLAAFCAEAAVRQ